MIDTLIGSAGLVMLLAAFGLNVFGRLGRESRMYDGLNAVGAGALVWYGIVNNTPIFVIMEATWALIAVIMLVPKLSRRARRRGGSPHR